MATISTSTGSEDVVVTEPLTVLNYGFTRGPRNVILEPLGSGISADAPVYPTVFLRPAQSRAGTLSLLFASGAAAETAQATLSSGNRHHFEAPEAGQDFHFIVAGQITVTKVEGVDYWTVDVQFREVVPT